MTNVIQMRSAADDNTVTGSDKFDIGPTISLVTSAPGLGPSGVVQGTRLTALFVCPTFERQKNFVDIHIVSDAGSSGPFKRAANQPSGTFTFLTFIDDVPPG